MDALKNVDEAQKKLVSIEPRLDQIERMLADPEADLSLVIVELRDVVAHLNGILQVGGCDVYRYDYSNVCTYSMSRPMDNNAIDSSIPTVISVIIANGT